MRYGTLNPSEDEASTFGDLASGEDFMGPLPQILRRLIQQQKFNVLVKLALRRLPHGDTQDIESGNIAGVALADLDKAIASAPPGQVSEITMQAFEAAKESPRLFHIFVVKPTPKASEPKS